jgi:hypothetical protein
MSARTCPSWPELLELAPDLQFKHYTVAEARLPSDALVLCTGVRLDEATICCDPDHHVFNAAHTDETVGRALRATHWYELGEWASTGPGGQA